MSRRRRSAQAATCLNPSNVRNLKQVGHSLYLLGKHKAALGVYEQARSLSAELRAPVWNSNNVASMAPEM